MPRPGTEIIIVDEAAPGGPILNTGQAFMVGSTERGPTDRALLVTSPAAYRAAYGDRSGGSLMADSASAFFAEGGGLLYVSRAAGAGAASATKAFGSMTANAVSPGTWGNDLEVETVDPPVPGGGAVAVVVSLDGAEVERSPAVTSADAAAAWSQGSDYVRLVKGADNVVPPSGTSATLAGGADGAAVDELAIADALGRFGAGLGPGQVLAPGLTSTAVHEALLAHVDGTRRCALLDLPDSADPLVLASAVTALRGTDGVRFAAAFAPWVIYPGPAGVPVTVPYSAVEAALIAQADRATGNPNQPAAGASGTCRYAIALAQEYTDADRELLNGEGVCMAKVIYGNVRTYGYRTAAGPEDTNWVWFGNSRVVMAVAHECDAAAENYVLRQIDGRRQIFAALEADLRGVCLAHFNAGALYGETPEEAFAVDTGPGINTISTISAGEIHAVVRLKCSPAAEWVVIEIVKVPVERQLATAA